VDHPTVPRRPDLPVGPPPTPELPALHHAGEHPPRIVAAHVRAGRWTRVRRGIYVDTVPTADPYVAAHHTALARIAAVRAQLYAGQVLSHTSAALLWGLPLLGGSSTVHVIQVTNPRAALPDDVVRHVGALPPDDVTLRAGQQVTTLERTAIDCAMGLGPADGLVVLDAALHRGADPALLAELLARRAGSRGVRVARAVLSAADGGAESPGESLARLAVLRLGVVRPVTQVAVVTHLGRFWADFGWPQWRVVGEYDGVSKYTARGDAVGAVLREKRRQEAMEEAGTTVLRVVAADRRAPALLLERLRRVLPAAAFGVPVDPFLG
jgi:very-short-patch-repair endonuclease